MVDNRTELQDVTDSNRMATEQPPMGSTGSSETSAMDALGLAWELHCKGLGSLFALVMLASVGMFSYMMCTRHQRKYSAVQYYAMLICCMGLLGFSRALSLFLDPYGMQGNTHMVMTAINMNLANAFLASAIYMLLIVLVRLTKMRLMSKKALGLYCLIGIVMVNVAISVVADIIAAFQEDQTLVMVICGSYFMIWDACCCAVFVYILVKLHAMIFINRRKLLSEQSASSSTQGTSQTTAPHSSSTASKYRSTKMPVAMKISLVIFSIFFIHICSLLYGTLVRTVWKDSAVHQSVWGWWGLNTVNRGVELAFAVAILVLCAVAIRSAK